MDIGAAVRKARRRAGLSQRALAARTGIAQPTIARIEGGIDDPRTGTLQRLLAACDEVIEILPREGVGVDRTLIHHILRQPPPRRLQSLVEESAAMGRLVRGRRAR